LAFVLNYDTLPRSRSFRDIVMGYRTVRLAVAAARRRSRVPSRQLHLEATANKACLSGRLGPHAHEKTSTPGARSTRRFKTETCWWKKSNLAEMLSPNAQFSLLARACAGGQTLEQSCVARHDALVNARIDTLGMAARGAPAV